MTKENMGVFTVRLATENDAEDIAKITHSAFLRYIKLAGLKTVDALAETADDVKNDIKNKLVLAAFLDDKAVGCVRVAIDGETAYLSRFAVSNEYQNLGIGKSLINMVDVEMRSEGVRRLCLHTASKVASLIRFYYSRGFFVESTSTDKGYIRALLVKEY